MSARRKITTLEESLVRRLLKGATKELTHAEQQLSQGYVREVDPVGSVQFDGVWWDSFKTHPMVIAEGKARDSDGVAIHVLLHAAEGYLVEFEVFKEDGSLIKTWPSPESFVVTEMP